MTAQGCSGSAAWPGSTHLSDSCPFLARESVSLTESRTLLDGDVRKSLDRAAPVKSVCVFTVCGERSVKSPLSLTVNSADIGADSMKYTCITQKRC